MGLRNQLLESRAGLTAAIALRTATTGARTRLWGRCEVAGRVSIGDRVRIIGRPGIVRLLAGAHGAIEIGDETFLNHGVAVSATDRVTIGARCQIAPDVMIMDDDHHHVALASRLTAPAAAPVKIGDDVWIAARSIILKGVSIGDGSVVAANSVVTRSVPPMSIVGGVPARVVGTVPAE